MRAFDWHLRLYHYFERTATMKFEYGKHDCGIWTAGAVDAMCDTHLVSMIRSMIPVYSNVYAVERAYARIGIATHADVARQWLGDPIRLADANRGDVGWVPASKMALADGKDSSVGMLGVLDGGALVSPSATIGLKRVPVGPLSGNGLIVFRVPFA